MENEENISQEEQNNKTINNNETDKSLNVSNLVEKLESLVFEDRIVDSPNKKRVKILSAIADERIVEVGYLNKPTKEGTLIKASDMNCIKELVLHTYNKSTEALKSASEALNISNGAPATFNPNEKAQCDASNISNENVGLWRKKLQIMGLPIGMIIPSAFIQNNECLHLLDGAELDKNGPYSSFYQWVVNNINSVPHYEDDITTVADYPIDPDVIEDTKTAMEKYQKDIDIYGQCGKFIITDTYVKLPTITEFIASNNDGQEIGLAQLDEFKSHTHKQDAHKHTIWRSGNGGGAWTGMAGSPSNSYSGWTDSVIGSTTATNQNTGGSETRPKNVRYPYYIVIANKSNEEITVNIECVKTTGNQIISGMKTFEDGILVPDLEV